MSYNQYEYTLTKLKALRPKPNNKSQTFQNFAHRHAVLKHLNPLTPLHLKHKLEDRNVTFGLVYTFTYPHTHLYTSNHIHAHQHK